VITDAQTVLEIAKVFDELSPSSSGLPSTKDVERYRETLPSQDKKVTLNSSKRTTLVL
jgi:hypothetical protein